MKKITGGFFCALFLFWQIASGVCAAEDGEPAEPSLYATSAALVDADSGRVLYGKNADEPMAMASTTKIMTCILILENVSPDDVLTVSAYAASMPKVKLYLKKGEQYTVRDLLYSLMLESHNDSAVALAEHVGKTYLPGELADKSPGEYTAEESRQAVAAFARLMNEKAAELGCRNTWFITPNGLDAVQEFNLQDGTVIEKQHSTTAAELAQIMAYCIEKSPQKESFLGITRTANYSFSANGRSFSCTNHNAFLNMMEGALSGKTGFTNKAGYCYVGALERDGRTFVVSVLACGWPNNKTWKWNDTRELMQYGIDHFFYRSFLEEGIAFDEGRLEPIPVLNGQTENLGETARTRVEIAERKNQTDKTSGAQKDSGAAEQENSEAADKEGLLLGADEEVRVEYSVSRVLEAPVESGSQVGTIEYIVDGVVYRRESIVTVDSVEKITLLWCLEEVLNRFAIPLGML